MKVMPKEVVVTQLVSRYMRRLEKLDARGVRAEWNVVFGDEYPDTTADAVDVLCQDYEDWMNALEGHELEAVWEDLVGSEIQVIETVERKHRQQKAA